MDKFTQKPTFSITLAIIKDILKDLKFTHSFLKNALKIILSESLSFTPD